jgi:hypothetical protein
VVKKSSFFEKLKTRWKSGSGVSVQKSARDGKPRDPVEARLDRGVDSGGSLPAFAEGNRVSGRKLSPKEEARLAIGEGFQELSSLVRGVQTRVEDQGGQAAKMAEEIQSLPALGRSQLDLLQKMASHFEQQTEVGAQLLQKLGDLPGLLGGVQQALEKATATDARTADTLDQFRETMDRIEGSMEQMVETSKTHVSAATDLVRGREAEEKRVLDVLEKGRDALLEHQRDGVERIESATATRLDGLRRLHQDQTERLTKLVTDNGKWTQLLVVLLSLTFFAIAGILAVLALK